GIPVAASSSANPNATGSRVACGRMLMPTPSAVSSRAASTTRTPMPAACRLNAAASPPIPAPTTKTSTTKLPVRSKAGSLPWDRPVCDPNFGPIGFALVEPGSAGWIVSGEPPVGRCGRPAEHGLDQPEHCTLQRSDDQDLTD